MGKEEITKVIKKIWKILWKILLLFFAFAAFVALVASVVMFSRGPGPKHCNAPDDYGDWGLTPDYTTISQEDIKEKKYQEIECPQGKEQGHPKIYPCDDNDQEYGLYGCWSQEHCNDTNVGDTTVICFSLVKSTDEIEDPENIPENISQTYKDKMNIILSDGNYVAKVTHGENGWEQIGNTNGSELILTATINPVIDNNLIKKLKNIHGNNLIPFL
tara:strand:+ start:181 stop:828 length:648 start_codon:yes stop_codon:yes gene_type:complete